VLVLVSTLSSSLPGLVSVPTFVSRRPANTTRFTFLDPRAANFFVEWDRVADQVVAVLRSEAGRDPYDRGLSELVG
jgi:hypothetical protein